MWKFAVVVTISAPIESGRMITLSWIVCLDVYISAVLTSCNSVEVKGGIFGIPLLFFRLFNDACPICGSLCLGASIDVDVDS